MNRYENEIAERLQHHLMRRNNTAPTADTSASSSSPSPLQESGGASGKAAAAKGMEKFARVEDGGRSSATDLAGADVQCDVR